MPRIAPEITAPVPDPPAQASAATALTPARSLGVKDENGTTNEEAPRERAEEQSDASADPPTGQAAQAGRRTPQERGEETRPTPPGAATEPAGRATRAPASTARQQQHDREKLRRRL